MPLIKSTYTPAPIFKLKHLNTVYRTLFSNLKINYTRERVHLNDGDFIDLDVSQKNNDTLILALHGLEGSSKSKYIISLAKYANKNNISFIGLNFRGCSGELNKLLVSYHSGKTDDLSHVLKYIEHTYTFKKIIIVGYSLGGNVALKYLGEDHNNISKKIKACVAISVPCDLTGSSIALSKKNNTVYIKRFMKSLKRKALIKAKQYPSSFLDIAKINKAKNFNDFDSLYTAPAHGFVDALDYWEKNSSKQFIKNITVKTLIINALDDTFLSKTCYPFDEALRNENVTLEVPKFGGHVGFNNSIFSKKNYWLEKRILEFINQ